MSDKMQQAIFELNGYGIDVLAMDDTAQENLKTALNSDDQTVQSKEVEAWKEILKEIAEDTQ